MHDPLHKCHQLLLLPIFISVRIQHNIVLLLVLRDFMKELLELFKRLLIFTKIVVQLVSFGSRGLKILLDFHEF